MKLLLATASARHQSFLRSVEKAVRAKPERLVHGETKENSFFVGPKGDVIRWADVKWGETNLRGYALFHSHLSNGGTTTKIVETFSWTDIRSLMQLKTYGVVISIVLTSARTVDILEATPRFGTVKGITEKMLLGDYDSRAAFHAQNKGSPELAKYRDSSCAFFAQRLRQMMPSLGAVFVEQVPINLGV